MSIFIDKLCALHFFVESLSRMRFIFGRNFPAGLADELIPSAKGE